MKFDTSSPVWLITGCSTGFGRELAKQVLERGHRAIVTARRVDAVADIVAAFPDTALALPLDVTDEAEIIDAKHKAMERFGRVDVLVNNAGYGYFAAVEEGDDDSIRRMFDANVFGLAAVTRAFLPVMRAQKSGCIVNLSSIAGLNGAPSGGYYSATKFAVEGLSEGLRLEVEPLGIKVMLVEPGPFRTDFASRSIELDRPKNADYEPTVGARVDFLATLDGKQPGDPVRGCTAIIDAVMADETPFRLPLGKMVYDMMTQRLKDLSAAFEATKDVAIGADYPA